MEEGYALPSKVDVDRDGDGVVMHALIDHHTSQRAHDAVNRTLEPLRNSMDVQPRNRKTRSRVRHILERHIPPARQKLVGCTKVLARRGRDLCGLAFGDGAEPGHSTEGDPVFCCVEGGAPGGFGEEVGPGCGEVREGGEPVRGEGECLGIEVEAGNIVCCAESDGDVVGGGVAGVVWGFGEGDIVKGYGGGESDGLAAGCDDGGGDGR